MTAARKTTPARKAPAKRAVRALPHRPEGVREPQDHLAPAAQREAEGEEYVPVEWDGLTFEVLADPDEWSAWEVLAPLSANNVPQAVLGLLGREQAVALRRARPNLKSREMRELFDAISAAVGFRNAGN